MFKLLQMFTPILQLANAIFKNVELNSMIKDSSDTKDLVIKAIEKASEKVK